MLTIKRTGDCYDISVSDDTNSLSQIWEVVPYNYNEYFQEFDDGLLLKSKMYRQNDNKHNPQFLSYSSGKVCTSIDRTNETKIKIYSPPYWTRFGEAYLNYLGWESTGISSYVMKNYFPNVDIGVDSQHNIELYNGNHIQGRVRGKGRG